MKRSLYLTAALVAYLGMGPAFVRPAAAQSLPATTIGLYPPDAGEVAFADLRALRQSPHYASLRAQLLPARLAQLEGFANSLGIDLETQANQLSWAFTAEESSGAVDLISVAEGEFDPAAVLERARKSKLVTRDAAGHSLISSGTSEDGKEFVFTLPDAATLVFGSRATVEALLARRNEGRGGLSDSSVLSPLISTVNGRSPAWVVLDQRFAARAAREMAPALAGQPQADSLLNTIQSGFVELTLTRDFSGHASLLCKGPSEAQLLGALLVAGVSLAATQVSEKDPDLAQAVRSANIDVQGDRIEARLALEETRVAALLAKNNLSLKF
jgi:hypothetical protein